MRPPSKNGWQLTVSFNGSAGIRSVKVSSFGSEAGCLDVFFARTCPVALALRAIRGVICCHGLGRGSSWLGSVLADIASVAAVLLRDRLQGFGAGFAQVDVGHWVIFKAVLGVPGVVLAADGAVGSDGLVDVLGLGIGELWFSNVGTGIGVGAGTERVLGVLELLLIIVWQGSWGCDIIVDTLGLCVIFHLVKTGTRDHCGLDKRLT